MKILKSKSFLTEQLLKKNGQSHLKSETRLSVCGKSLNFFGEFEIHFPLSLDRMKHTKSVVKRPQQKHSLNYSRILSLL